ncbi:Uncharacterised protein [Mycobacteroides abscessus subsp. massiliense]|uniref:hypothetical protein n=1 Tax=Mycobacteroides abscessus TaxID=36809 RepID=UPI0009A587B0|nr:hypothetical protein [Mycobacteroides abscessus]SKD35732.1 Uncharacterised protein [Mycobacteroides abscessus subsp. massiliense]SKD35882.1 Uncharacterised protein [Mycobacteroides abscessus subsp. massiliense]SKD47654.1 Uncharacterised protein [Mycobacteroides abscessus subsp. massiliense]SKD50285.1 Uncharacterised protein [Mycobacteroides abscessus subsp. massiliense]SKD59549.1 Uncharacterised protein [Mycobacteroides abscessus subsp. massiliense]
MAYDPDHDHQQHIGPIQDGFLAHDEALLQRLSKEDLEKQRQARWELYKHVDRIWEEAKHNGKEPADNYQEWNAVAALRDLFYRLSSTAEIEYRNSGA